MKIDLHVHCQERSACGKATEEAQVQAAIAAGLDAIVFTDHHRLMPLERLECLNQQYAPFRVFGGI
jgi:histidinol phosphatase-like PHP family hydrolase